MKDMQAQLEKLRTEAAECALIRDLATEPKKRGLFARPADHLTVLASEVELVQSGSSFTIGTAEVPPLHRFAEHSQTRPLLS